MSWPCLVGGNSVWCKQACLCVLFSEGVHVVVALLLCLDRQWKGVDEALVG